MAATGVNVTTTLGELVTVEPALRRVSEQNGMSAKTVYHVAKLCKLVSAETAHFAEQRIALFRELGVERESRTEVEKRQGATVLEILPDKLPEFQRRILEVGAVPVTLEWGPIRSVDLPSAKASDLIDLGPLCELVDPEDTTTPPK